MKHFRTLFTVSALAASVFGAALVSAQDATPVPDTAETDSAKPYLGVVFEGAEGGVSVVEVLAGSPAETAGIAVGDVITAIGETAVTEDNIRETVQTFAAGDTVVVALTRGEEQLTLEVTLAEAPEAVVIPGFGRGRGRPDIQTFRMSRPMLGISIDSTDDGVVVTAVREGSPAEAAGILVDDVVTAINGTAIATAQEAAEAVAAAAEAAEVGEFTVTVSVTRGEESLELTATLVKEEMPDLPEMFGFGMGGVQIVPREGEEGAFDVIVPFRPADSAAVTQEVIDALASIGITIAPREGEEGLFDLTIPAESLGDGSLFSDLESLVPNIFETLEIPGFGRFDFNFDGPLGRSFRFSIPDLIVPDQPDASEGTA